MHPGFVLLLMARAFRQGSLRALLAAFLCGTCPGRYQIRPEERALRERFGADLDDYCARVRRWC